MSSPRHLINSESFVDANQQEEILTPAASSQQEEIHTPSESSEIRNAFRAHGWRAFSLFINTLVWMGVYYAEPEFEKIDDDGYASYMLHCMAMEFVSSLATLPFDWLAYRAENTPAAEISFELKTSFITGLVLLFQPASDWFVSMCDSDSVTHFDFEKYADPTFSAREIGASFAVFGGGFALISYVLGKLLSRCKSSSDASELTEALNHEEESPKTFSSKLQKVLRSDEWDAFKVGLQFVVFYFMDAIFDVDWDSFITTMPNVVGSAAVMAVSGFVLDGLPEFLKMAEMHCGRAPEEVTAGEEKPTEALEGIVIADSKLGNADAEAKAVEPVAANNRYRLWKKRPSLVLTNSNKPIDASPEAGNYIPPAYYSALPSLTKP